DGQTLAAVGVDQTISLVNFTVPMQRTTRAGGGRTVQAAAFSPDGKYLATAARVEEPAAWDEREPRNLAELALWKVSTGEKGLVLQEKLRVSALAFAPDGRTLAVGSSSGSIMLWDVVGRKMWSSFRGHDSAVRCLAFAPGGKLLASGGLDETVKLWDPKGREPLATLPGHKGEVLAAASSPD